MKIGNWTCLFCQTSCYGPLQTCYKCGQHREYRGPANPESLPEGVKVLEWDDNILARTRDWRCSNCKAVMFASSPTCYKCGKAKQFVVQGILPPKYDTSSAPEAPPWVADLVIARPGRVASAMAKNKATSEKEPRSTGSKSICFAFHKGNCKEGSSCKFSHTYKRISSEFVSAKTEEGKSISTRTKAGENMRHSIKRAEVSASATKTKKRPLISGSKSNLPPTNKPKLDSSGRTPSNDKSQISSNFVPAKGQGPVKFTLKSTVKQKADAVAEAKKKALRLAAIKFFGPL